jgi:hypothetical protein
MKILVVVCQVNVIDTTKSIVQDDKVLSLNTLLLFLFGKWSRTSWSFYSGSGCALPALPIREVVAHFLLFLFGKWLRTSCSFYSGSSHALLPEWSSSW